MFKLISLLFAWFQMDELMGTIDQQEELLRHSKRLCNIRYLCKVWFCPKLFFLYGEINLYPLFVYSFHNSKKYNFYAVVSMSLTFVCFPAFLNKCSVMFYKAGHKQHHGVIVSWAILFLAVLALKEQTICLIFVVKIGIYFTSDHRKQYYHEWHSQHSTNIFYIFFNLWSHQLVQLAIMYFFIFLQKSLFQ